MKHILEKKDSIFFNINMTFLISLILIVTSFGILYQNDRHNKMHEKKRKHQSIIYTLIRETHHHNQSIELEKYIKEQGFEYIKNQDQISQIINNSNLMMNRNIKNRANVKTYIKNNYCYLYISIEDKKFMIKDTILHNNINFAIIFIFLFLIIIFITLYITIIKKLIPLKKLHKNIENMPNQNFDIDCATDKKDEISQLSNQFHHSIKKINRLKNARNVFIRNIMHELKTPITKGKLLIELPPNEKNQEKFRMVFYRLENLINEFASIEELIGINQNLELKTYYLADIVDNAKDMLMCEEEQVLEEYENIKIDIDFKLFSIAIKNLIDNAIKYSPNRQIKISTTNNKIIFTNNGKPLQRELKEYFEPFIKDTNQNNNSFGLGLYITKHILDANGYKLEYKYENESNIFVVYRE
jgi:two-component system OmpR family sensor kinase